MRLQENSKFLNNFVIATPKQRKHLLTAASEEEIKSLIECVLNFSFVPIVEKYKKLLDRKFKSILKFNYKNLKNARQHFVRHSIILSELVEIIKSLPEN